MSGIDHPFVPTSAHHFEKGPLQAAVQIDPGLVDRKFHLSEHQLTASDQQYELRNRYSGLTMGSPLALSSVMNVFQDLVFRLLPEKLSLKTKLLALKPEGAVGFTDIFLLPLKSH